MNRSTERFHHLINADRAYNDLINNCWQNHSTSNHELDVDIKVDEIIKAGLHLKNKKAPGFDGFRNEMLKGGIDGLHTCSKILTTTILSTYVSNFRKYIIVNYGIIVLYLHVN